MARAVVHTHDCPLGDDVTKDGQPIAPIACAGDCGGGDEGFDWEGGYGTDRVSRIRWLMFIVSPV